MRYRLRTPTIILLLFAGLHRPPAPIGWRDVIFIIAVLYILFGEHLPSLMRNDLGRRR